jgi:acyl-CoA synthetase (NDP forming)/RimJ/RimL family protein N-acetyltransferase|tara:strand:- start:13013 stop:15679 length:2667 start_codon:yes stop_codon:yes gene_type:complete
MPASAQLYPRPITQNLRLDGPVLLRDGRSAILREAGESDIPALIDLLDRSSDESIKLRFFGPMRRNERTARFLLRTQLEGVDSGRFKGLCLILITGSGDHEKVAAVASCVPVNRQEAEVAFLVEDVSHGKGIGTLMIERLAFAADIGGMHKLVATTVIDNETMLKVFHDCGYNTVSQQTTGEIHVAFDIQPSEQSTESTEMRDRLASRASIDPLFHPASIAIVGVSQDPDKLGSQLLRNLTNFGYRGNIYPVHRTAVEIDSIAAVPSLSAIEDPLDLVAICIPAEQVMQVVYECIDNGARSLLVLSEGFAEWDDAGLQRQNKLLELTRENGMRLVGPNCLGLINTDPEFPVHLTFAEVSPPAGNLAMSSQSGTLSVAILDFARDQGIGFSSFVSVGNKADVSSNDLLQFWEDDPRSKLILLYLESLGNPRRFARLAPRVGRKKPILVVKGGHRSDHPLQADAFFSQIGVIRTDTLEQMFDAANLLSSQPLPAGNRLAIISNSRGMAEICAQACSASGLLLAEPHEDTTERLKQLLPAGAAWANPVDITPFADPELYRQALEQLLQDDAVHVVIAMYIARNSRARANIVEAIQQARQNTASWHEKPIICCFMDRTSRQPEIENQHERVPSYHFPESAARALGHVLRYASWLRRPVGVIPLLDRIDIENAWDICESARQAHPVQGQSVWLSFSQSAQLLDAIGIKRTQSQFCSNWQACADAAEQISYPVYLRTLDADREKRQIATPYELWIGWEELQEGSEINPVIVEEASRDSLEVRIGISEDQAYGPVAVFGLSGISTDLFDDVSCRITPLTDQSAVEMVHEIKSRAILEGYGGGPSVDKEGIIDCLLRLSWLVEEVPLIDEITLSPAQVLPAPHGLKASLVRVRLKP